MSARKAKGNQSQQRGTQIAGNVSVKNGDFVGGNKNVEDRRVHVEGDVTDSQIVTGDGNQISQQIAVRDEEFQKILKRIQERPDTAPEDKEDLKAEVQAVQVEAAKEDGANESFLAQRLRSIKRMAPDILQVVLATLTNPAAGFALVVQKIAEKMKTDGENAAAKA